MSAPHTSGPWVVLHKSGIFPDGNTSLAVGTAERHREGWEANARLMASAPDLLAALKQFVAHYPHGINSMLDDACSDARDAIAKAEGATP